MSWLRLSVLFLLYALVALQGCGDDSDGSDTPCSDVDCGANGLCVEVDGNASCECDAGYVPDELACVPVGDPCSDVDCGANGQCTELNGSAICECDAGYNANGLSCVPEASPCLGVECSGHGACVETAGAPSCQCEEGYQAAGLTCVPETDPCEGVSCSNHGECVAANGEASCVCDEGFEAQGLVCIDSANPCEGVTCSGHGTCEADGTSVSCLCATGYVASGLSCIEEAEDPCRDGGIGTYGVCDGTTLMYCDENGDLITGDCAVNGETCGLIDTSWGYECVIAPGQECDPAEADWASRCDPAHELLCINGVCATSPGYGCAQIGFEGACDDTTLYWCQDDEMQALECPAETTCGYLNDNWGYDCLLGEGAVCDSTDAQNASLCDPSELALVCQDDICQMPVGCVDGDGDDYGVGDSCLGPDCDDQDSTIHTGCRPDCADSDDDGYGIGPECLGLDCDDHDDTIHEGCPIDCIDGDGDGYGFGTECLGTDCDDDDNSIYEGCPPPCLDNDNDDYGVGDGCAGPDCDDDNPNLTTDCSLDCLDTDGDGYGIGQDCLGTDCDSDDPYLYSGCAAACTTGHNDGDQWEPDECPDLAVELTGGEATGHSIDPVGDVDWYWFDVDHVAFDLALELETPAGTTDLPRQLLYIDGGARSVGYDSYEWPSDNVLIKHYRNLHKGRYWIKVADTNQQLHGTYTVRVTTTDLGATADEWELDPNRLNGISLLPDTVRNRSLWPLGEEDWFVIELTAVASDLSCVLAVPESAVDRPTYSVYFEGSDRSLVIDDYTSTDVRFATDYRNLPAGTYYVKVEDRDSSDATRMHGTYSFEWSAVDLGATADTYEVDNSRDTASVLAADTVQHHALMPTTDIDFVRFELTAPSNDLSVRLEVPDSAADRPTFGVYRDEDDAVITIDSYDNPTTYRETHHRNLPAGTYYIRVVDWNDTYQPRFHAHYTIQWSSTDLGTTAEANEPNDTLETATSLAPDTTYHGAIDPLDDVDYLQIELTAPASDLNVQLSVPPSAVDRPTYQVYRDGVSTALTIDEYINPDTYYETWYRNLPAGTYTIRVADRVYGDAAQTHGSYSLSYTLTDLGAPAETGEPNGLTSQATLLPVDTVQQHAIAPMGDIDVFAITVSSASNLSAVVTVPSNGVDRPSFKLTDGANDVNADSWVAETTHRTLNYLNLPQGTYYLFVYDYGTDREYGTYSVSWSREDP